MLYVHYQERVYGPIGKRMLLDTEVSLSDFVENWFDEYQCEYLLNHLGEWSNNGVVYLGEDGSVYDTPSEETLERPLEYRIVRIFVKD